MITEKWIITRRLGKDVMRDVGLSFFFPFFPQKEVALLLLSSLKKISFSGHDHFDNLELLSAKFWTTNFCPSSDYFSVLQVNKYLENENAGTAQTTWNVSMFPRSLRPCLAASLSHLQLLPEPLTNHFVQCLQLFKWENWLESHIPVYQ